MGQRLVITVHAFDEDIATIYYHWSAYTTSALDEAQKILKNVKWEDTTSKDELILRIVRFMESNGGCIDFEDKPEFNKRFPNVEFKDDGSRNDGLVAISKQVMDKQRYWSEGDLIIDFDNEMICNSVFWWYDSDESLRDELGEDCDIDFDTIPELKIDPGEFSFDDLTYMIKTFTDGYSYHRYQGEILESIDG